MKPLEGAAVPVSVPPGEIRARKDVAAAFLGKVPGEREMPASELGAPKEGLPGSEVHLSSFELMTVSGADAKAINDYLEKEARRRFKTGLEGISDEQYGKLLSDKEAFSRWMAIKWVDDFISARKEEVRGVADQVVGRYGEVGKRSREKDVLLRQPEAATVKAERDSITEVKGRLRHEVAGKFAMLKELESGLLSQHQTMISEQRQRLESQGFESEAVKSILSSLEATYTKARTDLVAQQERAIKAYQDAGLAEIESRSKALAETEKRTLKKLELGTKREMVLAADRWGKVLKKIAEVAPGAINRAKETGQISLKETTREIDQIFFDHIDNEVDRVIAARSKGAESGLRQHNIEALFRTKDELDIATRYLDKLSFQIKFSGSVEDNKLIRRHQIVFSHIRKQGFVSPVEALGVEAEYKKAYEKIGPYFPTALIDVARLIRYPEKEMTSFEKQDLFNRVLRQLEIFTRKGQGPESDYGVMSDVVLAILEDMKKDKGSYDIDGRILFELQQALLREDTVSFYRGRIMEKIYDIRSQSDEELSIVSGYYRLPDTLIKDFMAQENNVGLTKAAARQMRIHFRTWAKTPEGQKSARNRILEMTEEVRRKIERPVVSFGHESSAGTDPRGFTKKMERAILDIQERLKEYRPQLELLEQMEKEF